MKRDFEYFPQFSDFGIGSFMRGAGKTLDIGSSYPLRTQAFKEKGKFSREKNNDMRSDLKGDWHNVGSCFHDVRK